MPTLTFNTRDAGGGGGGGDGVTNVGTGTGLTGGPITSTGVISFADVDDMMILANISGDSAAPIPNTLSDILDDILSSTQGSLIYRNATEWTTLSPGTTGQFLQTQGPSGNPLWANGTAGTNFPYVNTLYVSQANGNDSNSGASINEPLLLAQTAITTAANAPTIIYLVDAYNNTETLATLGTGQVLTIIAPATSFQNPITLTAGDAVTIQALYANSIIDGTSNSHLHIQQIITYSGTSATSYIHSDQLRTCEVNGGQLALFTSILTSADFSGSASIEVCCQSHGTITNDGTATVNGILGSTVAYGLRGAAAIGGSLTLGTDFTTDGMYFTLPAVDGITGQTLTTDGDGNVSWQTPSAITNFNYTNAIWVDENGNDDNSGTSINEPLALLQTAITTAGTTPTIIYIPNAYTNSATIATLGTGQHLKIVAPYLTQSGSFTLTHTDQISFEAAQANNLTINGLYDLRIPIVVTASFGSTASGWAYVDTATTVTVAGGNANLNISQVATLHLTDGATVYTNTQRYTTCTNDGTATLNRVLGSIYPIGFGGGNMVYGPFRIGTQLTTGQYYALPAFDGSGSQVLTTNGAGVVTWETPTGGSANFPYVQTLWVASNGDDTNPGTSINLPKKTFQAAHDAFTNRTLPMLIRCEDSGVYTDDLTISYYGLDILAPDATLQGCTLTFATTSGLIGPAANVLTFKTFDNVSYVDNGNWTNPPESNLITLNVNSATNATVFNIGYRSTTFNLDYYDSSNLITQSYFYSAEPGIYTFNIGNDDGGGILATMSLISWSTVFGTLGRVSLGINTPFTFSSQASDLSFNPAWRNATLNITPSSGRINITLTQSVSNSVPSGFRCRIIRNGGSGNIGTDFSSPLTILSAPSDPVTNGDGGWFDLEKLDSVTWAVTGNIMAG